MYVTQSRCIYKSKTKQKQNDTFYNKKIDIFCQSNLLTDHYQEVIFWLLQLWRGHCFERFNCNNKILNISIYTLSDLGVLSNLIGSLSLANEHYSPPTE